MIIQVWEILISISLNFSISYVNLERVDGNTDLSVLAVVNLSQHTFNLFQFIVSDKYLKELILCDS